MLSGPWILHSMETIVCCFSWTIDSKKNFPMPVDLSIMRLGTTKSLYKNFNNETWNHQVIIYIYIYSLLLEAHGEAFANLFSQSFVFVLLRVYTLTTRVVQGGENSNCLYI